MLDTLHSFRGEDGMLLDNRGNSSGHYRDIKLTLKLFVTSVQHVKVSSVEKVNSWLKNGEQCSVCCSDILAGWTMACQACATYCRPEPDWLMGRIIHLMVLSWHCSLLSSLVSPGTSRLLARLMFTQTQSDTHSSSIPVNEDAHILSFPPSYPTSPNWFPSSSRSHSLQPSVST